ncbi:MAG: FAD-dependent monooxygenase [Pseudonocardiaceae bacterium]
MTTSPRAKTDILVVGAGPSGLTAALQLARYGVQVRIVDRKFGPVEQARATIVHARTLEYLDRLGLADQAMEQGVPITRIEVHEKSHVSAHLPLFEPGIEGRTRFPCALSLEQSKTERILVAALAEYGVTVEWGGSVESVTDNGREVSVTVRRTDQVGTITARRVVAADGASSTVRRWLGIAFTGTTYPQTGLLADVALDVDLPPNRLRLVLTRGGFVGILPIGGDHYRLFGAVPPGFTRSTVQREISHDAYAELAKDELQRWFDDYFQVDGKLGEVSWASLFRFHSRIADRFSSGNVFLVGDAAHIHNPAGGQGLNLGVGDAMNLAWKLALVARGEAKADLLKSYEIERRSVAQTIIRNTDRGFKLETISSPVAMWMRMHLAKRLIGPLTRLPQVRRIVFRMLSQTWIGYRGSPAVATTQAAGGLHPGDRAPHTPLIATSGGILHVTHHNGYHLLVFEGLSPTGGLGDLGAIGAHLPGRYLSPVYVHVIPRYETAAHEMYAAHRTRLVLVRPDGHIASVSDPDGPSDIVALITHLDEILLPRPHAPEPTATSRHTPIHSAQHRKTKDEDDPGENPMAISPPPADSPSGEYGRAPGGTRPPSIG